MWPIFLKLIGITVLTVYVVIVKVTLPTMFIEISMLYMSVTYFYHHIDITVIEVRFILSMKL